MDFNNFPKSELETAHALREQYAPGSPYHDAAVYDALDAGRLVKDGIVFTFPLLERQTGRPGLIEKTKSFIAGILTKTRQPAAVELSDMDQHWLDHYFNVIQK